MKTLGFTTLCVMLSLAAVHQSRAQEAKSGWLLIGDSHVMGAFGSALDLALRQSGKGPVRSVGSCDARPESFLSGLDARCGTRERGPTTDWSDNRGGMTPLLATLLATQQPAVTVVVLGGQLFKDTPAQIESSVRLMGETIRASGSLCVWVAPPHSRLVPRAGDWFSTAIRQGAETAKCAVIDSRLFKDVRYPDRGGDGMNFDSAGEAGVLMARAWASETYETLQAILELQSKTP